MSSRLPQVSDFSSTYTVSITPPPASGKPVNVLILLHGLGDTHESMRLLGDRMALPETVCISLQGSSPLPFDIGGYHWGDDIAFDQSSDLMDPDTGFKKSSQALHEVVNQLLQQCHYKSRDILFFGFGQGGMLALKVAVEMDEIGGVISLGGPPPIDMTSPEQKSKTPVILLGGASNSAITESSVSRLKRSFEFVEDRKWRRPGDGAPRNRDEMLPIMQFFSRRLKSRHGVPEGSVELM